MIQGVSDRKKNPQKSLGSPCFISVPLIWFSHDRATDMYSPFTQTSTSASILPEPALPQRSVKKSRNTSQINAQGCYLSLHCGPVDSSLKLRTQQRQRVLLLQQRANWRRRKCESTCYTGDINTHFMYVLTIFLCFNFSRYNFDWLNLSL